ncbi:tetratricopeptide repeat protein 16 [Limanda limanda]|uniref:tetratricopeptide repeat protein 16 n=1 Tax=Limanda limanda TaxID=27771 RepID=UPI0029C612EC|nr:tetratricopeptide repeat protein 16 [Limanda limanda]
MKPGTELGSRPAAAWEPGLFLRIFTSCYFLTLLCQQVSQLITVCCFLDSTNITQKLESVNERSEEQGSFPSVSQEEKVEKEEDPRRNSFKQLFGSSETFLVPGEKLRHRMELTGKFILQSRAAEHYSDGEEAVRKRQYEKAVICFSKAVTLQPEQSGLFVAQAESYLQLCDFQSAAACFHKAELLAPGAFSCRLAFTYYLQGQCLFHRALVPEALDSFSRAAELEPGCRVYAARRLACLAAAGRHGNCLKLVNDWMTSDGPTSDLYVLRARLHRRLQQTSQCHRDVRSALALNPTCPEASALLLQLQDAGERARLQAVERALGGRLPEAVCRINAALENCPRDARLHLFRGILHRRLKDFTAAIEDLVQAVELSEEEEEEEGGVKGQVEVRHRQDGPLEVEAEFQLVLTYNDFAVQCFSRGLYAEAALLLNKAIEEEKEEAGLYLNRGDCFFKQGEWCYALSDYQQAEEIMRPDDPALRLRLAVLHNTLGSLHFQDGRFQEAVDMLSLSVHYDPSAARSYEDRAKSLRKLLQLDRAREDVIRTLILDPSGEELPAMLMSLFPGRCVSEVLSSPAGQQVRGQLTDAIQACGAVSEQPRRSEKLRLTTLTNESTAIQSGDSSGGGAEPRSSVDQQEAELTVRSLLQGLLGKTSSSSSS